jgi:Protein of unknown function (DUF3108)
MHSKYLFFLVIPALFIASSCSTEKPKIDEFLTFSTEQKPEPQKQKPTIVDKTKTDIAIQTATEKKLEGDDFTKKYNLRYLTFDVANFYGDLKPIEKTNDYTKYQFKFYSKANGFIDYVFNWMSYQVSEVRVYKNKVVPESFKSKINLKKKTKEILLDYDNNGRISFEKVTPPDNRAKRPAVENKLKAGSFDPLSIVLEARRLVMNAFDNNSFDKNGIYNFTLALYDGRKRTDVNFELSNKKTNGLYYLKFTMKSVAGYTNNELKDIKKGERIIGIYIDPETFTPVTATGWSPLGTAKARLVTDCTTSFEDCIK